MVHKQQQYFLRHKVLTEYFFLPISETEIFFQSKLPTENVFPQKTIAPRPLQVKWMFPYHCLRKVLEFYYKMFENNRLFFFNKLFFLKQFFLQF